MYDEFIERLPAILLCNTMLCWFCRLSDTNVSAQTATSKYPKDTTNL